jgi:hypothetical protein
MIASDLLWDVSQAAVQTLTPVERWSAARRVTSDPAQFVSQHGFILVAVAALVVLTSLLWWISHRRKKQTQTLTRELFAENAVRRGLSGRERQILLAIVMRSGLGHSHDIFTAVDAFDRGAAKLLAECVRTRTPEENERLKTEVAYLREKLGFRTSRATSGLGASRRPSSRDIPVGKVVEVTRRRRHASAAIRAEVVRNDDLELAVELTEPVETRAGTLWCARYAFGVYVWEFDTTAVTCNGTRLVLNHTDEVRFVNRRRFPRVSVTTLTLVARFPFAKRGTSHSRREARELQNEANSGRTALEAPVFVQGVITELAGPGLRIEVPTQIRPGERILVVFKPPRGAAAGAGADLNLDEAYVMEDVGQVRHSRVTSTGVSIAVELLGLNETEVDELVRITNAIASKTMAPDTSNADATERETVAATNEVSVGQEV